MPGLNTFPYKNASNGVDSSQRSQVIDFYHQQTAGKSSL